MKRILVITPRFPFDLKGACEQDRAHGILLLKQLGYDVHVITMIFPRHLSQVAGAMHTFGIKITPVIYSRERLTSLKKLFRFCVRVCYPPYWDGAAFEYTDNETQRIVREKINTWKPDLIWFDYTYLWPLYRLAHKKNIPIITRSINYEPDHYLHAVRKTPLAYIKYLAKIFSERRILSKSSLVYAITPREQALYERMSNTRILTLPLRRLSTFIGKNTTIHQRDTFNVFFMGSNYTVHHMMQALRFILDEVNPLLQKRFPNTFTIHILGSKLPESVVKETHEGIIFHGYVPDLDAFLKNMDIALAPSLSGEGMQQKVFEPIVRGIPTITSERALAGYPFYSGVHLITTSNTATSFVRALEMLIDSKERTRISQNAVHTAEVLFSDSLTKQIINEGITHTLSKHI